MPAQHVAKAAAVLIAVSAAAVPATSSPLIDTAPTSFVEVLSGPDQSDDRAITITVVNTGCSEP